MKHLPYVTQLMSGEVIWYDGPDICDFQKAQGTFDLSQPMAIEPGKGIVISVERGLP